MITLSVDKNILNINIKYTAPALETSIYTRATHICIWLFPFCFVTVMSDKCIKIRSCACFLVISGALFTLSLTGVTNYTRSFGNQEESKTITVTFPKLKYQCDPHFLNVTDHTTEMKTPSLESFIRASTAMEDQQLRLSGLAVFSKLANACQPLADVNKAKIQVNKIALVRLAKEAACPLQGLVEHAQNAGYSVVIFDLISPNLSEKKTQLQDKLMIPVLRVPLYDCFVTQGDKSQSVNIDDADLLDVDQTDVEIAIMPPPTEDLKMMQKYLRRLFYWFLLGPVITLEWLRRRKKLCCMSGDKRAEEDGVPKETAVESGLNSVADYEDTQGNYNLETEHEQTGGETQPLLLVLNDPFANRNRRSRAVRRVLNFNCGYVILIVVALPVGISSGGWSFFRFDQNEEIQQKPFWAGVDLIVPYFLYWLGYIFNGLPLLWSPLQILCFFLYSRFACKTTWTVPTNFSKLIRSDWFASNMYLLIFGVVVPYCSLPNMFETGSTAKFAYYATYNTVCTICNLIFIIILNKHNFVTRYVFYISVCTICAYIESDIVAVFYFMLNSEGSLTNLKLTALRTVAIGLTLTLSLSSSMHIIRKLTKPGESLFEGLGEK